MIQSEIKKVMALCWAASQGDLNEVKRLVANGVDLNEGDYDKRTPLHLAASEGHANIVQYFIGKKINLSPCDRWGGTPLEDARRENHQEVASLLEQQGAK